MEENGENRGIFSFMLFGVKEKNECTNSLSLFGIEMKGREKRKIMLIS